MEFEERDWKMHVWFKRAQFGTDHGLCQACTPNMAQTSWAVSPASLVLLIAALFVALSVAAFFFFSIARASAGFQEHLRGAS